MINLIRFQEYVIELMNDVNSESTRPIEHCVMGVKEEHLTKKLKDYSGICLCVSYPNAECEGEYDNSIDSNQVFFFVCEKVNPGSETNAQEISHYAVLQEVMFLLREKLRDTVWKCIPITPKEKYRIEWEYQIFGGFNGLSLGVILEDND